VVLFVIPAGAIADSRPRIKYGVTGNRMDAVSSTA
jgi:hypothetical protein